MTDRRRLAGAVLPMAVAALVASPVAAQGETVTFAPTGAEQTFTVPAGVTSMQVIAVGGRGGTGTSSPAPGGFGAVASGTVAVVPGELLYVNVGGNGTNGTGGFNGGGTGAAGSGNTGGGGGGASDLRRVSRVFGTSPFSRLVTAGAGGGSGGGNPGGGTSSPGGNAGAAGGGFVGAQGGQPGTAAAGGAGGSGGCSGGPGTLAAGGSSLAEELDGGGCTGGPPGTGGGGGAGVFGGGAGGTSSAGAGGGGGSSGFAPGVTDTSVTIDTTGSPAITLMYSPAPSGDTPPPPTPSAPPTLAGPGAPKPTFAANARVTVALATTTVPARGPLTVRVVNANDFAVRGRASGRTTNRISAAQGRRVGLKATSFSVPARGRTAVDLALPRALRRELARKRTLSVRLSVRVEDPAGQARTVAKTVKPRLGRRRAAAR